MPPPPLESQLKKEEPKYEVFIDVNRKVKREACGGVRLLKAAEDILDSSEEDEVGKGPQEYDSYFNALSNKLSFDQKSFAGSFNSKERKLAKPVKQQE